MRLFVVVEVDVALVVVVVVPLEEAAGTAGVVIVDGVLIHYS